MTVEPEPEREPEWAIPDPEWVPTSAEVIGTYLLKGPGSDLGTFWSCSVTVSRAGGGKLDCDIVDHWSEPSGSTTEVYECTAVTCVGGIVLTDRSTGRRFQAGVIDGGLRVNSALFPIAVSASFGAESKYYVLERIRDPHHLMQEQRHRAEKKADTRAKGRLSITSTKRRAEAKSRRALLEHCLPAEELERDARSPPATPLKIHPSGEPAVSPPDDPWETNLTASESERFTETELLGLATPVHARPAGERVIDTQRHVPWRERARKPNLPTVQQRGDDWPRMGPLVLTGDLATAAAAKARAVARLDAGEFPQATVELETAKRLAGTKDIELPVLLSQATAGVTAARGLSPLERSAWSRVYGAEEPTRLQSADDTMELQKFAEENGLEPQHMAIISRFIYLHPGESPSLSDIRNMDTEAFLAMLEALAFEAPKEAAFALAVARLRLPAALPQLKEFCPSTLEHILSGCGLADSAAMLRHQLGLSNEDNGVCELWKLACSADEHGGSDGVDEGSVKEQICAAVKNTRSRDSTFSFCDLLELTAASNKLGVKLRADILAVGCWWGDLEVRALWCSRFDNESMSVDELRGRLRVARASATFFQVIPSLGSLLHHWCGSCSAACTNRGDLLREAAGALGASAWLQRNSFGETPLHSLCANSDIELSVLQALADVIPPAVWRMRGHEGSPLHALCKQSAVNGTMLRVVTESWQDDDYIALLQTDSLGFTPVELLCQTCHDVDSNVAHRLPSVEKNGLRRELEYSDYHSGGLDGLSLLSQMAARGTVVEESTRNAVRQEMLQELIDADLTVLELRTRAKRSRVNVQDLNNQLATSGYVVRKGAYTSHTLTVGVLTQTRHDSRWGEVRMIAPAQVKLNWVGGGGGEFVSPSEVGEMRIVREDLLDERMGLMDLIAYESLRQYNRTTFAQWVEGGHGAIVNDFAEWERQAQAALAAAVAAKAKAIEDAQQRAAQEEAGRKVFQEIDKDGSGGLDARELKVLLTRLGRKATKKQISASQADMDTDGSGDISMDEFAVWWSLLDEEQRLLVTEAQSKVSSKSKATASDPDGAEGGPKTASNRSDAGKTKGKKKKGKKAKNAKKK